MATRHYLTSEHQNPSPLKFTLPQVITTPVITNITATHHHLLSLPFRLSCPRRKSGDMRGVEESQTPPPPPAPPPLPPPVPPPPRPAHTASTTTPSVSTRTSTTTTTAMSLRRTSWQPTTGVSSLARSVPHFFFCSFILFYDFIYFICCLYYC